MCLYIAYAFVYVVILVLVHVYAHGDVRHAGEFFVFHVFRSFTNKLRYTTTCAGGGRGVGSGEMGGGKSDRSALDLELYIFRQWQVVFTATSAP